MNHDSDCNQHVDTQKSDGDTPPTVSPVKIRVLFFAAARDAVDGQSQIDVTLDANHHNNNQQNTELTANTVRDYLLQHYPKLRPYIHQDVAAITMALNEVYIPHGTNPTLHNNDVIAIIPPISGG